MTIKGLVQFWSGCIKTYKKSDNWKKRENPYWFLARCTVNLRNAYPKIAYCRQFWGRHFWVNPSSEMPTPVILYIFTFLFIFLWPFGVNILESVCLLLSNLEIQSILIHYNNNIYIFCPSCGLLGYPQPWRCHALCRHCLGPTGDLFMLIWQPCVEKKF